MSEEDKAADKAADDRQAQIYFYSIEAIKEWPNDFVQYIKISKNQNALGFLKMLFDKRLFFITLFDLYENYLSHINSKHYMNYYIVMPSYYKIEFFEYCLNLFIEQYLQGFSFIEEEEYEEVKYDDDWEYIN